MIEALVLACVLSSSTTDPADGVTYRDLSVAVEGELIDARMLQVVGDERPELLLVERSAATKKREIHIYTYTDQSDALETKPWRSIPVFDDVIAFTIADVRDEPGHELLFFTRGGVFAMSPGTESLRGNIALLIRTDLIYEVPDPTDLPYWDYVLEGERDSIVVPGSSTFSVWSAAADGSGAYVERAEFSAYSSAGTLDEAGQVVVRQKASVTVGGSSAGVSRSDSDASRVLIRSENSRGLHLLSFDRAYAAPGIADVNGDGEDDLVVISGKSAIVYLSSGGVLPAHPSRVEELPDYLLSEGHLLDTATLRLEDLDADGDADIFVRDVADEEDQGVLSNTIRLIFLRNDGRQLFPAKPDQLMRFEALELRAEITDVDADGILDLVVRKFEVPSVVDVVTSLEFTHTTLLYPGKGKPAGQVFERRAVLKSEQVYDEDSVGGAIAQRTLSWDCSDDGIADLVEVDIQGRVRIQLVRREASFFSGDTWSLDRDPWKRFDARGEIGSLVVDDFNGDGLGDILSRRDDGVLLLFSSRQGRAR